MTGLELIKVVVGSFVGTLMFAPLLHAPREAWLPSAGLGCLGYSTYVLLVNLGLHDAAAMFLGCLLASALAQVLARKMRMIATVFMTLSIIPCVPGLGLYESMSMFAAGDTAGGAAAFAAAMTNVLMIALALAVSGFLAQRLFHREVR